MVNRILITLLLSSISIQAFANKIDVHKVNSQLSPAIINSVPGQWTLVQLWALDCLPCERQKPALSSMNSDYNELTVLGLSVDGLGNAGDVRERIARKLFSFDNYIAELKSVKVQLQNAFNTKYVGTPTYILYSPVGKIMAVHAGPIDLAKLPQQLKLTKAATQTPTLSSDLIQ